MVGKLDTQAQKKGKKGKKGKEQKLSLKQILNKERRQA
jgi:hypothetical protein